MNEKFKALKESPNKWWDFGGIREGPKCPHCGHQHEINGDELYFLYDEANSPHEMECSMCDEEFSVDVLATYSFSTDNQKCD